MQIQGTQRRRQKLEKSTRNFAQFVVAHVELLYERHAVVSHGLELPERVVRQVQGQRMRREFGTIFENVEGEFDETIVLQFQPLQIVQVNERPGVNAADLIVRENEGDQIGQVSKAGLFDAN